MPVDQVVIYKVVIDCCESFSKEILKVLCKAFHMICMQEPLPLPPRWVPPREVQALWVKALQGLSIQAAYIQPTYSQKGNTSERPSMPTWALTC